jgi:hypothetical protein
MSVRSVIPAKIGRPSAKAPTDHYRRLEKQPFARKADAALYGQRSQSETVNSMLQESQSIHFHHQTGFGSNGEC